MIATCALPGCRLGSAVVSIDHLAAGAVSPRDHFADIPDGAVRQLRDRWREAVWPSAPGVHGVGSYAEDTGHLSCSCEELPVLHVLTVVEAGRRNHKIDRRVFAAGPSEFSYTLIGWPRHQESLETADRD